MGGSGGFRSPPVCLDASMLKCPRKPIESGPLLDIPVCERESAATSASTAPAAHQRNYFHRAAVWSEESAPWHRRPATKHKLETLCRKHSMNHSGGINWSYRLFYKNLNTILSHIFLEKAYKNRNVLKWNLISIIWNIFLICIIFVNII